MEDALKALGEDDIKNLHDKEEESAPPKDDVQME
jgi:hypothetical protein